MDWLISTGSLSLGLLIGAIVGWYFNARVATDKMLGGSISALVGSSVLAMFAFLGGHGGPLREFWFYPVGLLIGFMAVTVIEIRYFGYDGSKEKKTK